MELRVTNQPTLENKLNGHVIQERIHGINAGKEVSHCFSHKEI